jgi:hypothetical protein
MIYSKYKILSFFLLLSLVNTGYVGYFHHHKSEHCNSVICYKEIQNAFCSYCSLEEKHDEKYGKCAICELISTAEKYATISLSDFVKNQLEYLFHSIIPIDYKSLIVSHFDSRAPPKLS